MSLVESPPDLFRMPTPGVVAFPAPLQAAHASRRQLGSMLVAGMLLFALGLLPRAHSLDQYVTVDEDLTLGRSGNFADALSTGRWHRTYQIAIRR